MTYLCVPIFVRLVEQAQQDVSSAIGGGAEMIELRIDTLQEPADALDTLFETLSKSKLPWIVTCRAKFEGGHYAGSESDRLGLLRQMADKRVPYLDLELAAGSIPMGANPKLILSSHDFLGRPERLYNLLLEMDARSCDVKKIAWTARTLRDNLEAFEILQKRTQPTIALCMGEAGIISRILAKKFGAFLTFASLTDESATAPGQVSIAQMKGLYRWDKMTPATKVYGVVAHPVGHSMSPAVHNAAFDASGYDGVYVPLLVNPGYESFKAFMESFVPFAGLDLCGLSITLPHKENALKYLREKGASVEELAARIGAVNTILIDRSGDQPVLSGINTDYAAILDSITAAMNWTRNDFAGMSVGVIGAGGTGRTAVAALTQCGAKVSIFNRTLERATALAKEFSATAEPWENLAKSDCRVYINTTSVGMHPNVEQSPWGDNPPKLGPEQVVFDTIYNPMSTRFLQQASAAGAHTIGGVEMFVRQAAVQFCAWTKINAPLEVMRPVIEARLKS